MFFAGAYIESFAYLYPIRHASVEQRQMDLELPVHEVG